MNTKLGNKQPNLGKSLTEGLKEAIQHKEGKIKLRETNRQWCNDLDAQRIIENREETIQFLTDEVRRLKKEVIQLNQEIENIGPAMKRQQETIVILNAEIDRLRIKVGG